MWRTDPLDQDTVNRLRSEHAKRLGFADTGAWFDAEYTANRALDGDEIASWHLREIDSKLARVIRSRAAAAGTRRSKWADMKPEALRIIERIRLNRPNLSGSSVAGIVLDELAHDHRDQPGRSTILDWIKDFDG